MKYRVIENQNQYDEYCNMLELMVANQPENSDEIALLSLLIENFNERSMENYRIELDPVQILSELIEVNHLTQIELSKKLNVSPQLLNDILKYRREITKKMALKLADFFKLKFSTFLRPYPLKKAV